jgi:hypothetical protein
MLEGRWKNAFSKGKVDDVSNWLSEGLNARFKKKGWNNI